ncbi:hypothetical protein FQA47_007769 [Oryzias melastigma]|nr:hypothetical protein FQA47_007769 [Oryzias melastigma]
MTISENVSVVAAEPVPDIIVSDSVLACDMNAESEEPALPCPEPEVESKMENGNLESPSATEDVADPVNGELGEHSSAPAEECVNGNEEQEETPIKEQSDFELKKDVTLCGDAQEVPPSGMMDGLSTEVTQAV